jgi:hypothetical protein
MQVFFIVLRYSLYKQIEQTAKGHVIQGFENILYISLQKIVYMEIVLYFCHIQTDKYMRVLVKTMEEMPELFTSNEFNKMAIKNGYPAQSLRKKGLASFIKIYADNEYEGSKTWLKRGEQKKLMADKEMIEYLKSKGYKIMKPVNEWVEC